jgi:hypothetical protein
MGATISDVPVCRVTKAAPIAYRTLHARNRNRNRNRECREARGIEARVRPLAQSSWMAHD